MKILLVYPEFPDTFWSFKHALKFINKKINNPPLGLLTISALLPDHWERKLVDTNIHRLSDRDIEWADMIFLSAMDVQRKSVKKIIKQVKTKGKPIVAGGPLFTGEYESFPLIDTFILNEGEITLPEFLHDIEMGIAPKRLYTTDKFANIKQTPAPDISLLEMNEYDCMSIQFSRGCPFQCDFCNVTALLGHTPRTKSVQQIINELDQLYDAGWRRNIFFVDDNFIGNKKFIKDEILPALIEWKRGKEGCHFITEASINLADDEELMDMMAQAGFVDVFIGIETPIEDSLIECNKKQNSNRDLIQSVKTIQAHGMQVMAGFIVGFDNDPNDVFDRLINFIQESGIVTAMVGLLQAPYGTKLYSRLSNEGRLLKEMTGDNADGTTNIITKMNPSILRTGYFKIMESIYSPNFLYPRIKTFLKQYSPQLNSPRLHFDEISAFFKTIFLMGFNFREARYYWDLLFWTLRNDIKKVPVAVTLTIYGYHFRKITDQNMHMGSAA